MIPIIKNTCQLTCFLTGKPIQCSWQILSCHRQRVQIQPKAFPEAFPSLTTPCYHFFHHWRCYGWIAPSRNLGATVEIPTLGWRNRTLSKALGSNLQATSKLIVSSIARVLEPTYDKQAIIHHSKFQTCLSFLHLYCFQAVSSTCPRASRRLRFATRSSASTLTGTSCRNHSCQPRLKRSRHKTHFMRRREVSPNIASLMSLHIWSTQPLFKSWNMKSKKECHVIVSFHSSLSKRISKVDLRLVMEETKRFFYFLPTHLTFFVLSCAENLKLNISSSLILQFCHKKINDKR